MDKYAKINIAKIKAWTKPTIISKNIKGMGKPKANKADIEANNTSPAKILLSLFPQLPFSCMA